MVVVLTSTNVTIHTFEEFAWKGMSADSSSHGVCFTRVIISSPNQTCKLFRAIKWFVPITGCCTHCCHLLDWYTIQYLLSYSIFMTIYLPCFHYNGYFAFETLTGWDWNHSMWNMWHSTHIWKWWRKCKELHRTQETTSMLRYLHVHTV